MAKASPEVLYHYTDRKGYNSIVAGVVWVFKAAQPPPSSHPIGAYFTTRGPQLPNRILDRLFIPRKKRKYVFVFRDTGDLIRLKGGRGKYVFYSSQDYLVERSRQIDHGTKQDVATRLKETTEQPE
jgi:hypothetical protein